MGRTLILEMLNNRATRQKPPIIIELVGPAGSGKTTLSHALSQRDERILVAEDIGLRGLKQIPVFISHTPFLLPVVLCRNRRSRGFTWNEIKWIVYLKAWPRILRQPTSNNGGIVLLDHGPVFKLATLDAFGPEILKSQGCDNWWREMFKQWASVLDMVVWLDAPDAVLVQRINSRNQRHAVKGKSESEACQFLARYRTSYHQMLARLDAYGGPALLQFDARQASVEQIADEVLAAVVI